MKINIRGKDFCFDNLEELKKELLMIIEKVDANSIILDLENLIEDKKFVLNLGKNIKDILKRSIKEKLDEKL